MKRKTVQRMGLLGTRWASELCVPLTRAHGAPGWGWGALTHEHGGYVQTSEAPQHLGRCPSRARGRPTPTWEASPASGGLPDYPQSPACWPSSPHCHSGGPGDWKRSPHCQQRRLCFLGWAGPFSPLPSRGDRAMESRVCYCYFQLGKTVNVRVHNDRK